MTDLSIKYFQAYKPYLNYIYTKIPKISNMTPLPTFMFI